MNDIINQEENAKIFKSFLKNSKDKKGNKINYVIEAYKNKLGSGSDGTIYEVKVQGSNRILAAKLISNINDKKEKRLKMIQELKGPNIIRIESYLSKEINKEKYAMLIMEKAVLRDLGKLNYSYFYHNLLKLLYEPFEEHLGDNLLRFYCKQIIESLELLNRNNYVHFDIKPENILITLNLIVKLSDFSLLHKLTDENAKIPGGTPGYVSREYYDKLKISKEKLKKQDYFSLGSTIFYLKYGENMLDYDKFSDPLMTKDRITDLLTKRIEYIKSRPFADSDFIDFLLSLIQYNPDERPIFEQIYRNKWLNKNLDIIRSVTIGNEADEEKLIMELQKSDFLKMKQNETKKKVITHKKFVFKVKEKKYK